jgi:hypothetical protein
VITPQEIPCASGGIDDASCRKFTESIAPIGYSAGQGAILSRLRKIGHRFIVVILVADFDNSEPTTFRSGAKQTPQSWTSGVYEHIVQSGSGRG